MHDGLVEVLSTDFAIGWALTHNGHPAHLCATLDDQIIGVARADIRRSDLQRSAVTDDPAASILSGQGTGEMSYTAEHPNAFLLTFDKQVRHDRLADVRIHALHNDEVLGQPGVRIDQNRRLQVFVLGSPRSGTSECAATLAKVLELPWFGEAHAAPAFQRAADLLSGDPTAKSDILKFMAAQSYRTIASDSFRKLYYYMHGSISFIDKTPGAPMIKSGAFLVETFPTAKFIFMRRNGISNVLSRMKKFGGSFEDHCADWAAAMSAWAKVKGKLPHFLEVDQEVMLTQPEVIAGRLSSYLGIGQYEADIATSLRTGTLEHTGAGIGRTTLAATGWSDLQIRRFRELCGPVMLQYGYAMD